MRPSKLTASDAEARDFFGFSAAIDDDTLVIGATGDDDAGLSAGAAYVFARAESTWIEQAKLIASDGTAGDVFGAEVAIDGDTLVVSATGDDDSTGAVYVFVRTGTVWSEQAKLIASDATKGAQELGLLAADFDKFEAFGISVGISGDTIVAGATGADDACGPGQSFYATQPHAPVSTALQCNSGAAFVYERE